MRTRIVLIALIGVLGLPLAPAAFPVVARPKPRIVTRTFSNPASITIPTAAAFPVSADRYPAPITVNGLKGKIRDVNLTLDGFQHTYPIEVQLLLVGPGGQTATVLANVGGGQDVTEVTLRLDDEAATSLPVEAKLQSGTFRPTNGLGGVFTFNPPAPEAEASAALSIFDGSNPNGTWRLFVQDGYGPTDAGGFEGGWALEITTKVKVKKKKR
jgi:hypothetical protein